MNDKDKLSNLMKKYQDNKYLSQNDESKLQYFYCCRICKKCGKLKKKNIIYTYNDYIYKYNL